MLEPRQNEDGVWEDLPSETTVEDEWTMLVVDNGMRILTFGIDHAAGGMVHIIRPDDTEVATWHCDEWETDGEGESVVGAFLRAAAGLEP